MHNLILVINPGSTSTKLAIFDNEQCLKETTLRHSPAKLSKFANVSDQLDYRKALITDFMKVNHYEFQQLKCIAARGGLLRPIKSGTYLVNEKMVTDLNSTIYGEHASNLGAIIADAYTKEYGIPSYVVDPVVVDELWDLARVSGTTMFDRKVIFHALNHKAVARRYAKSVNRPYEDLDLIIAHLGGGVTIGWHHQGRVIDVNDGLGGDGPFSPERAGGVPAFPLIDVCFAGKMNKTEIKKQLVGNGGMMAYLGTSDMKGITEKALTGDQKCDFYTQAMAYQVAKEIGSLYFIAKGKIDQLLITGGVTYNKLFMKYLQSYLDGNIKYTVFPGEDEMLALAQGALRVINHEEKSQPY